MSPISATNQRDQDWINDAIAGDQKAFKKLFEHYNKAVYHLVLKIIPQEEDAEDITFITFTKAFSHLSSYESSYAFSTWIFKIASNTAIDFLRKQRISTVPIDHNEDKDWIEQIEEGRIKSLSNDPEQDIIRQQRHQHIQLLIEKLDPEMAMIIRLRFFEEKSYNEIAQALQLPLGTVKVHLHRAKKELAKMLKHLTEQI